MRAYIRGWHDLPKWKIAPEFTPKTSITVLIPARNEAQHIQTCVNSVFQQNYPLSLFEIIIIDDHSTDGTPDIVTQLNLPNVQVLSLADVSSTHTRSFKKRAIELGVAHAKGNLIVSTDADCLVPQDWLRHFASYYQNQNPVFIAAPVNFHQEKNAFERFQSLDFIGMMGITGAGIHRRMMHMCNGANLAYPKAIFHEVGGFEGIDHLASGDDMLLMQKIAHRFPNRIGFIKNKAATVLTYAKPTWSSFVQQRIRWASKSKSYSEWKVTFYLAMVFLFCCSVLVNFFLLIFIGKKIIWLLGFQLLVKMIMDAILLWRTSAFFERTELMRSFGSASLLHLIYIVWVGLRANFQGQYHWKGRKVR